MPDSKTDPVELIKRAALGAVDASKPMQLVFGVVHSAKPLQIYVEQKMLLGAKQLVLCRNVTDFTVMMSIQHNTESASGGSGEEAFAAHSHAYKGVKAFTVQNALKAGEKVLLLRLQGGQKFLVLDRLEGSA